MFVVHLAARGFRHRPIPCVTETLFTLLYSFYYKEFCLKVSTILKTPKCIHWNSQIMSKRMVLQKCMPSNTLGVCSKLLPCGCEVDAVAAPAVVELDQPSILFVQKVIVEIFIG